MTNIIEKLILKFHRLRFKLIFGRNSNKCNIYGQFVIKHTDKFNFKSGLTINDYVYINATNGVYIGENVSLSAGAKIITVKLDYSNNSFFDHVGGQITIGNNVQIGAGAIILPGVNITNNVIIGAGCVVSKDINHAGVYVGIPAVKIK